MKDIKINKTIAEASGWTGIYTQLKDAIGYGQVRGCNPNAKRGHRNIQQIPDYCNDLNALHEVMDSLNEKQYSAFRCYLDEIAGEDLAIIATARQRAEAFINTISQ